MGYCFMTLEKIKNFNQMAGKFSHNYRKVEVLNADKDKAYLNEELVSLEGKSYKEAFESRMKSLGYALNSNKTGVENTKKIRSNAVYAFEVVTTFSREDREHVDIGKWKKSNVDWLTKEFNANPNEYGNNVLSVIYHGDEAGNVHCHAIIVPIDDKGNLNARYYVRSRQKMIELQDSYGKLMKAEHNLNRGIKNSTARHQDIKRYYASLNANIQKELPNPNEYESAKEYQNRVNELYKDANLKAMNLEDKYNRLNAGMTQEIKNKVSEAKKSFYDKFQKKVDAYDELEREFNSIEEVKENCERYDNLIEGVAIHENKDVIIPLIDQLIQQGYLEKEKYKNIEKSL